MCNLVLNVARNVNTTIHVLRKPFHFQKSTDITVIHSNMWRCYKKTHKNKNYKLFKFKKFSTLEF